MFLPLAAGSYKNATGTGSITGVPATMTGFYVNNTSSGVIQFLDGGSGGTAVDGNITPAIGWNFYPASFTKTGGPYLTLVSGSIDLTIVFNPIPVS